MPNTSAHNIYYPDSATNIAPLESVFSTMATSVDTAIESVADDLATLTTTVGTKAVAGEGGMPYRMSAGLGTSTSALPDGSSESFTVTFPTGRFNQTPIVTASSSSPRYTLAISAVSSTGFTLTVRNNTGTTGTSYTYYWHAVQMTVGAGNG